MEKIKLATVFSGIGSIEFAFKRIGVPYDIVFACDNGERDVVYDCKKEFSKVKALDNPFQKRNYVLNLYNGLTRKKNFIEQSYLANYDFKYGIFFEDIKLLDGTDFKGKVDILAGGSPCQSFSSVGKKAGINDARGTLFYEFARLIKEIEPKVFIYENVRNLQKIDNGKTWNLILGIFDSLGYNYKYEVLDSANFGIPQKRRRIFVVGYKKKNANFEMPKGKTLSYKLADFLITNCKYGDFISNNYGEIEVKKSHCTLEKCYYLSPKIHTYVMKGGTKGFYSKPVINCEIARTLLKTMGNKHRAGVDNYVSDDGTTKLGKVRCLTEREALRLMGFTDDFKIVVSKAQIYKQAGNSIVVDVMIAILREIINSNILEEK